MGHGIPECPRAEVFEALVVVQWLIGGTVQRSVMDRKRQTLRDASSDVFPSAVSRRRAGNRGLGFKSDARKDGGKGWPCIPQDDQIGV